MTRRISAGGNLHFIVLAVALWAGGGSQIAKGAVLWSHPETISVCNNGKGEDILHGAIKPHNLDSSGTLYFRVMVDPIADTAAKVINTFEAGFMLVENGQEHLGIGNAHGAMAYSMLNVSKAPKGFEDFNSSIPDPPFNYEYMRAGTPRYLVLKVEYIPGQDARVTAWLNPDLSIGATEFNQLTNLVVHFDANATFDEFHLIHRGYGGGWKFSQMMVASSFEDLLIPRFWQQKWFFPVIVIGLLALVASSVRLVEQRRALWRIQQLERERAVASERTRIARDIHDEVGAELAQIGLLADLGAESQSKPQNDRFFQIARRARNLVAVMDEIVWAVNPQNDNLTRLADYLCQVADDCFTDSPVRMVKEVPTQLPAVPVRAEVRHDLTLAVKEAFANLLKHSHASETRLRLSWDKPGLEISVEDNGCGFDPAIPSQGNGLANQQARLKRIGGTVELASHPGGGTRIIFRVKLDGGG
ncbi:MAG TPA: ATP-binding protein [Verrucomicrobiae bacterium]|jgi:signal transduction histidine kinase|nr:ATP-binding protein [Verrucomicrobiae bacterium]